VDDAAPVPTGELERVTNAQRRFEAAIAPLDDDAATRPSLLPGWTVGHLLTHVARNADSHVRRAKAASRNEVVDQYPGGYAGRTQEIEEGATRTAAELIADVQESAATLHATWRDVPASAWSCVTRDVSARERPLRELPFRRWRELEVHVVDLDVGVTYLDWSDEFVAAWLPRLRATLPTRLPAGADEPTSLGLSDREKLAWLYGRLQRDDLPPLAPWG
jgi:maleylpyruvate isomerase